MFSSFASAALLLEKVALDPSTMKMLAHGAGGAVLAGVPTYLVTRALNRHEREKTRDRAFGAGVATGLAGPKIVKGLFNIAQGSGFLDAPQAPQMPQQQMQPSWGPL